MPRLGIGQRGVWTTNVQQGAPGRQGRWARAGSVWVNCFQGWNRPVPFGRIQDEALWPTEVRQAARRGVSQRKARWIKNRPLSRAPDQWLLQRRIRGPPFVRFTAWFIALAAFFDGRSILAQCLKALARRAGGIRRSCG